MTNEELAVRIQARGAGVYSRIMGASIQVGLHDYRPFIDAKFGHKAGHD